MTTAPRSTPAAATTPAGSLRPLEDTEKWPRHSTLRKLIESRANPAIPSARELLEHVRIYRDMALLRADDAAEDHWDALREKFEELEALAAAGGEDRKRLAVRLAGIVDEEGPVMHHRDLDAFQRVVRWIERRCAASSPAGTEASNG